MTPQDLHGFFLEVAWQLRRMGYRVSTAEIVKAIELASAYNILTGRLTREDLTSIVLASFASARPSAADVDAAVRIALAEEGVRERARRIREEIEEHLGKLRARPGDRVSRKKLAGKRGAREALASYLTLKRIGAIQGSRGKERLLDRRGLESLAWRIARMGYESLEEAARGRLPKGWDDMLLQAEARLGVDPTSLSKASSKKLLDMARAADRKGDRRLRRAIAEEIARRVSLGDRLAGEAWEAARLLDSEGLLTPSIRKRLAYSTGDVLEGLSPEEVAEVAESMGVERGGVFLQRAVKRMDPSDARRLLSIVDPRLLWSLRLPRLSRAEDRLVEAASAAARALREALRYAETGEPGRADMAVYYAEKARSLLEDAAGSLGRINLSSVMAMIREAEAIVELVEGPGEAEVLQNVLARLDYSTSVTLLRSLYARSTPEARRILIDAMERLLYRFAAREGAQLLPRRIRLRRPPGRIDVRRTLYSMIRGEDDPLVYVRKARANRISLALDFSGSMLEYAAWTAGIASMFPRHLRRLVFFSHTVEVYDAPIPRRLYAELLVSRSFQGYTNISAGLRAASIPGVSRIVAVTDLKQTVEDEGVDETVSKLASGGKKILFIVPRGHDATTRRAVERAGARVIEARSPKAAAKEILRSLLRG